MPVQVPTTAEPRAALRPDSFQKLFKEQGWLQPPHAASSSVEQLGSSYVIELSLKFSNLNGKVRKGYWSFWASRLLKKMRLYDTKTLHHCMSDPRGKREGNDAAFCTHMPLIKKDKPIFLHSCRAWVSTPFFTTPWNIYYLLSTFSQRIKKRVSTLLL